MVNVSREHGFEWPGMQEDPGLRYFRTSAPPEDRALFLSDRVGLCVEDVAPSESRWAYNRRALLTKYVHLNQWLDSDEMDLPDLEKSLVGSVDDLLYFFTWQPTASKSGKKHFVFFDRFNLARHCFSEEDEVTLKEVDEGREDKSLLERLSEAYDGGTEPKEKELLNRAAEQFGRRLSSRK